MICLFSNETHIDTDITVIENICEAGRDCLKKCPYSYESSNEDKCQEASLVFINDQCLESSNDEDSFVCGCGKHFCHDCEIYNSYDPLPEYCGDCLEPGKCNFRKIVNSL